MAKPTHKEMQSQIIRDSVLNFISYMPNPDDIASGTFESYETYRKMKKDPRIKSLLNLLKAGGLNFPLHIVQDQADEKVFLFRSLSGKLTVQLTSRRTSLQESRNVFISTKNGNYS